MYAIVTFAFERDEEDGGYVGRCLELPIVTEAETLDALRDNAEDALLEYLHAIEMAGMRDKIFEQQGIKLQPDEMAEWTPPTRPMDIDVLLAAVRAPVKAAGIST